MDILKNRYFVIGDSALLLVLNSHNWGRVGVVLNSTESCEERRIIERVNKFFKDARSLNKLDVFRHSNEFLVACVFIAAGFFNLKLSRGHFDFEGQFTF